MLRTNKCLNNSRMILLSLEAFKCIIILFCSIVRYIFFPPCRIVSIIICDDVTRANFSACALSKIENRGEHMLDLVLEGEGFVQRCRCN